MPIEIRELVIKASVDDSGNSGEAAGYSDTTSDVNQEHLVSLCVEKVLEILKEKQER